MIMSYLNALRAFFAAAPGWTKWMLAGLTALLAVNMWLHFHDRALIRAYEADVQARITAENERRDAKAANVLSARTKQTQERIEDAENAANASDDPLRAALDRLRADGANNPAAR